jgi:hypothetical protein
MTVGPGAASDVDLEALAGGTGADMTHDAYEPLAAPSSSDGSKPFWLRSLLCSPLLWLGVVLVLGQLLYLLGIFDPNPVLLHSNLSEGVRGQTYVGTNSIDPNDGFTSQALAHRAMLDWIGGHVPWWNPFEGAGAALAGEIQSAAFFPFAILTLLPNGQMWMYLVLSLIAGYSTYSLIRKLGFSPWIAFVAGVCFGLNGTFAWFRFAPANPVAFLPLMLLGVEIARERVQQGRRSHWWIIAVGLSLSLVAGFPETTYLDALLVVVWTIVRCIGLPRPQLKRLLKVTAGGGVVGALLSGPFLAGVAGYLPYASLGPNTNTGTQILPPRGISTLFFPYGYGTLWDNIGGRHGHLVANVWGTVGGYTTAALLLLAVFGVMHRELRSLKIMLAVWCAAMIAGSYGTPLITPILRLIPGMTHVVIARYMNPSLTMALAVLAAFGLRDIIKARLSWLQISLSAAGVIAVAAVVARQAARLNQKVAFSQSDFHNAIAWGFFTLIVITAAALLLKWKSQPRSITGSRRRGTLWRVAAVTVIALLPVEALGMFVIPELSAPSRGHVDMRLVDFLQRNIGHKRFATLGPILPNYGSYYGIASIMENDLPLPKRFSELVLRDLDPDANPVTFTGTVQVRYPGISPVAALRRYVHNYEALGVKYLLVTAAHPSRRSQHRREILGYAADGRDRSRSGDQREHRPRDHGHPRGRGSDQLDTRVRDHKIKTYPAYKGHCSIHHICRDHKVKSPRVYHSRIPRSLRGLGLRRVYSDSLAVVYELPHGRGLFHAAHHRCTLHTTGWYSARASCSRPTTVTYNQIFMPGWSATVNGNSTSIAATRLSQQRVRVPAGESTIKFNYEPKYADAGWLAALAGLIACLFSMGLFSRRAEALRRWRDSRRSPSTQESR